MNKVLIGVKDSRAALHAFTQAVAFSRRAGFRLSALTVAPHYEGDLALARAGQGTPCPHQTLLEEALAIATDQGAGLETFLGSGSAPQALVQLARQGGFDLIILGCGREWLPFGRIADRVVRDSPVDVLLIAEKQPLGFDRIVCAAGVSRASAVRARAMQLLAPGGTLHISTLADRKSAGSKSCADELLPGDAPLANLRGLFRQLMSTVRAGQADLLMVAEPLPASFWHSAGNPFGPRLLRRTGLPVWVVKSS